MKKLTIQMIAPAFALVLFLSFNALAQNDNKQTNAQTSPTSCSKTTDDEIRRAIKEQFEADTEIKDQMRHVNVSVKNRKVKLEGWLDGKAMVDKAVALATATKCVKRVSSKLKEQGGGSCGAGQKPCGDSCIDRRSTCDINRR